jgi:hypothetical protein
MSEHRESFEVYMAAGVEANNAGQHEEALKMRFVAYAAADGDVATGRAARDIGHSFAALDDDGEYFVDGNLSNGVITAENAVLAEAYADHAVWLHRKAVQDRVPGAEREYRASAGYVGAMALRRAIASEKSGVLNATAAEEAKHYLGEAASGSEDDQYTINFIGRRAIAAGLYENGTHGRRLAKKAWELGKQSESPELPYSTPNLSEEKRKKARQKALVRAAGAFVVSLPGMSASSASAFRGKTSRLRALALTISERLV